MEHTKLPRCTNRFGHHFQARYSKTAADMSQFRRATFTGESGVSVIEAMRAVTYERDICIRCGVTVERATRPTEEQ